MLHPTMVLFGRSLSSRGKGCGINLCLAKLLTLAGEDAKQFVAADTKRVPPLMSGYLLLALPCSLRKLQGVFGAAELPR